MYSTKYAKDQMDSGKCPFCSELYPYGTELKEHIISVHTDTNTGSLPEKEASIAIHGGGGQKDDDKEFTDEPE